MRLFVAGLYAASFNVQKGRLYSRLSDKEKEYRAGIPDVLESYHYVHKQNQVDKIRNDKIRVFLDSGAFSAFTQGVEIDMDAYCDYIKRNDDIIEVASVLDGIGDPLKTYQNQCYMEKQGTRPLPCFHYGEDIRYLEHYLDNYEYITLGGMVPISTKPLKIWLDNIWENYLTGSDGRPKVRVHGFGLTTLSLMKRYPWYSVDSSSWVQAAATGSIFIPKFGVLPVSHNSPALKQFGRHLDNMPEEVRNTIIAEVEKYGYEVERMRHQYLARWTYNAWAYGNMLSKMVTDKWKGDPKFIGDQIGLFK